MRPEEIGAAVALVLVACGFAWVLGMALRRDRQLDEAYDLAAIECQERCTPNRAIVDVLRGDWVDCWCDRSVERAPKED